MSASSWAAAGVAARLAHEYDRASGVVITVGPRSVCLPPELVRSLASWLAWAAGWPAAPSTPDAVRVAVDAARTALRERSAAAETTEDFRAGLAWCEHHLDAIAKAAS